MKIQTDLFFIICPSHDNEAHFNWHIYIFNKLVEDLSFYTFNDNR